MARGLRKGDGGAHLMTFHPPGGSGSSEWFHDEDWLDFNMRQNGHVAEFTGRYDQTRADYDRTPIKPVLDGEPIYEDHPVSFDAEEARPLDRRRRAAAALLGPLQRARAATPTATTRSGRCGRRAASPVNNPLMPWFEAIDQPGAGQMQHGRRLLESRPFLTRVPDDTVIVTGPRADVACRARAAIASSPRATPRGATRWSTRPSAGRSRCAWRRSRARESRPGGSTRATARPRRSASSRTRASATFTPPDPGEMLDWVLVLDDAAQGFKEPGVDDPSESSRAQP